jgi:hypothetical protein
MHRWGGGPGGPGGFGGNRSNGSGSDAAEQITSWVAANFKATTVDDVTIYDLSA